MTIARVALDVPIQDLFDYLIPEGQDVAVGQRVRVLFGNRPMAGIVVERADQSALPPAKLKPLAEVFDDTPPLPAESLTLLRFCADYYHHPIGAVVMNALPVTLRQPKAVTVRRDTVLALTEAGQQVNVNDLPARAQVARRLLTALQSGPLSRSDIRAISDRAPTLATTWLNDGWLEEQTALHAAAAPAQPAHALNSEQADAVTAIADSFGQFQPWLLHGITGAGKTEVYLHLINQALQQNRQALVLVPEINLTPQLEARFRARFPAAKLVSLHSNLADGARLSNWLAAQTGEAQIVLGTRLAVFTPMADLALIIVDEEHDGSFKQQEGLRYSARDMAVARARQSQVPIILGSATPSLETWQNATTGRYQLRQLRQRAVTAATLPAIEIIDSNGQQSRNGLTFAAFDALRETLGRGEQAMVFLNRRGYAPVLFCNQCGWQATCNRCSARMVVHLKQRHLRCHHCGAVHRIPPACPGCGQIDLMPVGQGTQRLEDGLGDLLPEARILRVDRDSTRRREAMEAVIQQVHAREVDLLVGTQMLVKGHDFPALTLVVAVDVDQALFSPDFRAAERLFAQLMQVAGRAGRAQLPGRVLIQTRVPQHPLFQALVQHDFENFAETLLNERRQAGFPPFCHQALLRADARKMDDALDFLEAAARQARPLAGRVTVFDPVPAQMARLESMERALLLVQSPARGALHDFLRQWLPAIERPRSNLRWNIDVDPVEF